MGPSPPRGQAAATVRARESHGWVGKIATVLILSLLPVCRGVLWHRSLPGETAVPYIVVMRDASWKDRVLEVCGKRPLGHLLRGRDECRMPRACRRTFTSALTGLAGTFFSWELARLSECLSGGIAYIEEDGIVTMSGTEWLVGRAEDRHVARRRAAPSDAPGVSLGREFLGHDAHPHVSAFSGDSSSSRALANSTAPSVSLDDLPRAEKAARSDQASAIPKVANQPLHDRVDPGLLRQLGPKQQKAPAALWNLDRVDQRHLPLDNTFTFGSATSRGTGDNVTIYVLDSGVRTTHQEFADWTTGESRATSGYDFIVDAVGDDDCDGHGTHVAATAAGRSVGMAKAARVVSVRVLDCEGSGVISDVVVGLDWVAERAVVPAVATLSLGIPVGRWSHALEDAVRALIARGVVVVVASGNSGVDSCLVAPANVPETITVAASDLDDKFYPDRQHAGQVEGIYQWSNTGPCVDLFAPGVDVYSACGADARCEAASDSAYTWASGTSMAVPHVAAAAAMLLGDDPALRPEEVKQILLESATVGAIESPYLLESTPNRLLYSGPSA